MTNNRHGSSAKVSTVSLTPYDDRRLARFGLWAAVSQLPQGAALVIADPERAVTLIGTGLAKLDAP